MGYKEFTVYFIELCNWHEKKPSQFVTKAYYKKVAEKFTLKQWEDCCEYFIVNYPRMPLAEEMTAYMAGTWEDVDV